MSESAAALVERVIHRAFRDYPDFFIDDTAPLCEATSILLEREPHLAHLAFFYVASLREFHENAVRVQDHAPLKEKYPFLAQIEERLLAHKRISKELAILKAIEWLRSQHQLPEVFATLNIDSLNLATLSEAQLQIVIELVKLGLQLKVDVPFDPQARGLLLPVQKILSRLESLSESALSVNVRELKVASGLTAFYESIFSEQKKHFDSGDQAVYAVQSSTFSSQAQFVAHEIRRLKASSALPISIAIAFRTLDARVDAFEESLRRNEVPYRFKGNLALRELPCAKKLLRELETELNEEKACCHSISKHLSDSAQRVSDEGLKQVLGYYQEKLKEQQTLIDLRVYFNWLSSFLNARDLRFRSDNLAFVTEIISVKQIAHERYDYVFLVDLAHGRFPKTESGSALTDRERYEINRILKRPVMQVLYDDPIEKSVLPSRFGFESLWFVNVIASVQKGLYLTSSRLDPGGREQALSEFFLEASRLIRVENYERKFNWPFRQLGARAKHNFGFRFEEQRAQSTLQQWMGLSAQRPLSPSRLEALATCPFKAIVERIFGIEDERRFLDDIDPRIVGKFVHSVLESYFRERQNSAVVNPHFSSAERQRLHGIMESEKAILYNQESLSRELLDAYYLWLSLIVERTVSHLLSHAKLAELRPTFFEYAVGIDDRTSKIVCSNGQTVFLGGIIDRIDVGEKAIAIIDYKMSSSLALQKKLSSSEMLVTHFQLPVYARLVLDHVPLAADKEILACFVSVRDGVTSNILGDNAVANFKELVSNDSTEMGLSAAINRVMIPILSGTFEARRNASCAYCHLASACRIPKEKVPRDEYDG